MDVSAAPPKPPFYFRWFQLYSAKLLTVLCYHRVADPDDDRFQGYRPNISASRADFITQMDFLRAHYNPISLGTLVGFLEGGEVLPSHPVLVTFDDGYRDNGEVAWPIMRERGIPLAVFLATDHIGSGRPFVWDLASYCFCETRKSHANVPLVGLTRLSTAAEREIATIAWVEAFKRRPGTSRENALAELQAALEVAPPSQELLGHFCLSWAEVQRLAQEGVEFGAHTRTHPILTNLSLSEATAEIQDSVERLSASLGSQPVAFAYPNGTPLDFEKEHEAAVKQSGVSAAFSLEPGPTLFQEALERPTAIRRIYIGSRDRGPRFAAKLAGAGRLAAVLRPPKPKGSKEATPPPGGSKTAPE